MLKFLYFCIKIIVKLYTNLIKLYLRIYLKPQKNNPLGMQGNPGGLRRPDMAKGPLKGDAISNDIKIILN